MLGSVVIDLSVLFASVRITREEVYPTEERYSCDRTCCTRSLLTAKAKDAMTNALAVSISS
jgi:hypothetical protein